MYYRIERGCLVNLDPIKADELLKKGEKIVDEELNEIAEIDLSRSYQTFTEEKKEEGSIEWEKV